MEVYIYKTSIQNQSSAKKLANLFKDYPTVHRWVVDTEDIDKVLKIESTDNLSERELIENIRKAGYSCEEFLN